jgi:hypothetical protein
MISHWALVAILAVAAAPAHAAITDIALTGRGKVAYSTPGDIYGTPVFGPVVGTPVTLALSIHIGGVDPNTGLPSAPPDGFSGRFSFDVTSLQNGEQYFAWTVAGGRSGARSGRGEAYQGGYLDFVHGRLTGFSLYTDSDPEVNALTRDNWRYAAGAGGWGGPWTPVPEPARWALLIAGFGMIGSALRARRCGFATWGQAPTAI